MIEIRHLRKEYESITPLEDVNVTINDGDIVAVIGPSGTGKSTLLRCINMLERPTSGQILFNGEDITDPKCNLSKIRQKMGMVFQSFNLFEHLTAVENIMLAQVRLLGKERQDAYDESMRLLKMVGLSNSANKYPHELSGGQKQRVAIVRTLAMDPDVILFDEPTSALDPTMIGEVETVIKNLTKLNKTMVIVTHEMDLARAVSNRVFYMDDGGIYEDGSPEQIFEHPSKEKTIRFIKNLKVIELLIEDDGSDLLGMQTRIKDYCVKNQIEYRISNRIQLIFEEAVQTILTEDLKIYDIRITIENDVEKRRTFMTIDYGNDKQDIRDTANELSLNILNKLTKNMEYSYKPDHKYANKLRMEIVNE